MGKITIEEELEKQGFHMSTIVGDSMMPMLRNRRDLVKIVPVKGILKKYDLPLYKRPTGKYVLHRIVAVKSDHYLICGDNRCWKEKVPFDWVVGVMESFDRDGVEIKADNEEYMKYVKKCCRGYWKRKIKRIIQKITKKVK